MAFRIKNIEVLTINNRQDLLLQVAEINKFGGTESEREEKEARIKRITEKILGDEMRPFYWALATVPKSGLTQRVNGMHSSEAFHRLNDDQWKIVEGNMQNKPIYIQKELYECDTEEDLPILFEQFDASWSGRSAEDKIGAHLAIHDDLKDIPRVVANAATKGMAFYDQWVYGVKPTKVDGRFNYIHTNSHTEAYLKWCGRYLHKDKTPEMLRCVPAMAAIYHTMLSGRDSVFDFWSGVAKGMPHNEEDTPEYKLAFYLDALRSVKKRADWPSYIRRQIPDNKVRPIDRDVFATCLNACGAALVGRIVHDHVAIATGKKQKTYTEVVDAYFPLATERAAA